LHAIVLGLIKQAHNLRSAVAKNAVLALEDMFFGLRHKADGEITPVTAALVKRCADSSAFISGSIDDCIVTMIHNTSGTRTLTALLAGLDNRNQVIRGKVSNYVVELVLSMPDEIQGATKELDSLIMKLSKLTQDSSPEARMNSREIIRLMITNGLITRKHMESMLTPDVVEKSLMPQASPKCSTLNSPLNRSKKSFGSSRRASPHGSILKKNSTPSSSFNNQTFSNGEVDGCTPSPSISSSNRSPHNSTDKFDHDGTLCVAGISPRGNVKDISEGGGSIKRGIASRRKANNSTPKAVASKKLSQNTQDSIPELVELPVLLMVSKCVSE
jgi:hypothetical protein